MEQHKPSRKSVTERPTTSVDWGMRIDRIAPPLEEPYVNQLLHTLVRIDFKHGVVRIRQDEIAAKYGKSERRWRQIQLGAERLGVLRVKPLYDHDGKRTMNEYVVDPSTLNGHYRQPVASRSRTLTTGSPLPSYTKRDKRESSSKTTTPTSPTTKRKNLKSTTGSRVPVVNPSDRIPQRRQPRTALALRRKSQSTATTPDRDKMSTTGSGVPVVPENQEHAVALKQAEKECQRLLRIYQRQRNVRSEFDWLGAREKRDKLRETAADRS